VGRRRFDHLFAELSVAAGLRLPRYQLWLTLHEAGIDPERLTGGELRSLCDAVLPEFLQSRGIALSERRHRVLRRELDRYDPALPTPYERFAALG